MGRVTSFTLSLSILFFKYSVLSCLPFALFSLVLFPLYSLFITISGRGEGVNPFVLTFRGNALCSLGRYKEAIPDYEAAANLFNANQDVARYSDARANQALALYQIGSRWDKTAN